MVARRVTTILVLVPIAVILIALSVANRGLVSLTIDPFNPGNPALSYTAPLFIWLFGAVLLGIVLGSLATWLSQGKHRRRERRYKREASELLARAEEAEKQRLPSTLPQN